MSRIATATRLGFREQARRPLLVVLLIGLPFFFITRAIAATEALPRDVILPGGGSVATTMREIHGANMAAITVGFLAGLVGVFVMQSARAADRRLVVAGFRPWQALLPRLFVLAAATALVVAVSAAVTAISFTPQRWSGFVVATAAVGVVYGLIGALVGAFLGKLAATHVMLFAAMLDLGIAQNPMFGSGAPPGWAPLLPGYGPGRLIVEASFSSTFRAWGALVLTVLWAVALGVAVVALLTRRVGLAVNYGAHRAAGGPS